MDGNSFSWCSYAHFEQVLAGAKFADIFGAAEAAFTMDSDLTAATLGPPAKVDDSDGLGPVHLWFADGRSRAVFACLPCAPEPSTWMVVRPQPELPQLLDQIARLPPAFGSKVSYIQGRGDHAIIQTTRYGFDVPLFRGTSTEVSTVLEALHGWGMSSVRVGEWRDDSHDHTWTIERLGGTWARYNDKIGTLFVAARSSLTEQSEEMVRCEQTGETIATFRCGHLTDGRSLVACVRPSGPAAPPDCGR